MTIQKQFQITALSVPPDIITKSQPRASAVAMPMTEASLATQIMNMSYSLSGSGHSFSHEQSPLEKRRAQALSTKGKPTILYQTETLRHPTGILPSIKISQSSDIFEVMKIIYGNQQGHNHKEHFFVLALNRANKIIAVEKISTGGMNGVVVDPKTVFLMLINMGASGFICVHNHPSANKKPSEADIQLTKKLKEGGKLLEISLLDHIIYTEISYYSFADEGSL